MPLVYTYLFNERSLKNSSSFGWQYKVLGDYNLISDFNIVYTYIYNIYIILYICCEKFIYTLDIYISLYISILSIYYIYGVYIE